MRTRCVKCLAFCRAKYLFFVDFCLDCLAVSLLIYLLICFNRKLVCNKQSEELQKKLRKLNYLIYHLRNYLYRFHLPAIYEAIYEDLIRYAFKISKGLAGNHVEAFTIFTTSCDNGIIQRSGI